MRDERAREAVHPVALLKHAFDAETGTQGPDAQRRGAAGA
ncbi:hypothetical protein FHX63_005082 [Cupriavidus plantarum]|uniref:Uncharacterized protein n=1 Tax=Cupriavidus plantarum TaxID=942865 RepID=A0A316ERB4_9BURK|nr:hypothetical protein [Cupriavidus plantarum]PWK33088.1 hypothetical protein C7419_10582 [Cupriavidus plantarum]